jgi:rhodanese-related sulfurtransferase
MPVADDPTGTGDAGCGGLCSPQVPLTVEQLLAQARAELVRLAPAEAHAAAAAGALIVDIRPAEQRVRDGEVPNARVVARNVLEWRFDSFSGSRVILVCDEGYQSSLAAATLRRLGVDATDMVGGIQAWREQGLPLEPYRAASSA